MVGVEAVGVDVEVDINRGLPAFSVVGLPDAAVREARERVRAAISNSGFDFPLKRITVSLAPSDLRKAGPGFDLAIAAAILAASDQLPRGLLERWALAGELALDGGLRPVRGALAMSEAARHGTQRGIALPETNAPEAALVSGVELAPLAALGSLRELAAGAIPEAPAVSLRRDPAPDLPDLADLRGQVALRRALEIAAAGGHSLLVVGPPGAGKSLAARRLPSILPPLTEAELIEVARIAGAAGTDPQPRTLQRPFRAPHHTISPAGLVGGGTPPRPGEITLAHRGVLFLDELAEFPRASLEALRQPLENGEVTIARARGALRFPASFQLIGAANPCPCGHGEDSPGCRCTPEACRRYARKLSGALADRIDLSLRVAQPTAAALGGDLQERSASVRERVAAARERQRSRFGAALTNGNAPEPQLRETVQLTREGRRELERGQSRLGLSGRGWTRALRVARTCADLEGRDEVGADHLAEALSMRVGTNSR
jgi:magnesium chelatase family protein